MLLEKKSLPDRDGDLLNDEAEFIVDTSVNQPDTDSDGIKDFAELRQGADPFDGRAFPTGIIANAPLFGEAKEVVVEPSLTVMGGLTAYVATATHGLGVVDVTQFNRPVTLGQLKLPGDAVDVAVDSEQGIAVVASGDGGLHFVDVKDPMLPRWIRSIAARAIQVQIVDSVVYAAVGNELRSIDLATGELFQVLGVGDQPITGLSADGQLLYTMSSNRRLTAVDLSGLDMKEIGSLIMDQGGGKLFVGGGVAYAAAINSSLQGGIATADVTDPRALKMLSSTDIPANTATGGTAFSANGSRYGLLVGRTRQTVPLLNQIDVLDVSDPTSTYDFKTAFRLDPAEMFAPTGVAIGAGLGFVAASNGGIYVANYLSHDTRGAAPTVTTTIPEGFDFDSQLPGLQFAEGNVVRFGAPLTAGLDSGQLPIDLRVTDDVQVDRVDLLMNGQLVATDVSFPWDLSVAIPPIEEGGYVASLQTRATDTGGNVAQSDPISLNVVRDSRSPQIQRIEPEEGSFKSARSFPVRLGFSERMDIESITSQSVQLRGPSGVNVTAAAIQSRRNGSEIVLHYEKLVPGDYELVIEQALLRDRAGNTAGEGRVIRKFAVIQPTAVWNGGSGVWDDVSNWESARVPGPEDVVLIDALGDSTVSIRGGDIHIAKLYSNDILSVSAGTLEVSQEARLRKHLQLGGGTLTGSFTFQDDGRLFVTAGTLEDVTLNGTLDFSQRNETRVAVKGGLTLNGKATLGTNSNGWSSLDFVGTQTLGGSAIIEFISRRVGECPSLDRIKHDPHPRSQCRGSQSIGSDERSAGKDRLQLESRRSPGCSRDQPRTDPGGHARCGD
jgi:hypothetical protein